MAEQNLQKSAETEISQNDAVPKEVLNPKQTAKQYRFRIYPPSEALVPFVDYFWTMRWDLRGKSPFTAEVVPSPYTNLTFMPEGARITGVTTGKYSYELKDKGVIIGTKFRPGALHAFYKKSLHTLTDTHVSAGALFTEIDQKFTSQMLGRSDDKAVHEIEQLLLSRKPVVDKTMQLVFRTMRYLESQEWPALESIAAFASLSERRLQEIFREYVGVGPKWIISRVRLIKAIELAARRNKIDWTGVALQLGYADQSHFTNDFKRIIGKSPTRYVADLRTAKPAPGNSTTTDNLAVDSLDL